MSKFTDQHYLKTDQYKDQTNLNARVELHKHFSTNSYGWFNWVFDALVKQPENAKILELGCGPAYMWKECANRIPTGWDITLSDLSSGMLDSAWRNLVVTGRSYKFKEIDAQEIPFENETFDAVIANHMLYHVPDKPKALSEISRVLKQNGHLFATTIGQNHMREMANWIRQVSPRSDFDTFGSSFNLENGLKQLEQFFSQVILSRYPDSLQVTEVRPIIAFLRSTMHVAEASEDEFEKLAVELEQELKDEGNIFIHKDSGLFEAVK